MYRHNVTSLHTSETSIEVIAAYDDLVEGVLSHAKSTPDALQRLLRADPENVMGWTIKCMATVMLARKELMPVAQEAAKTAQMYFNANGGTSREGLFVKAAMLASRGEWWAAISSLETILQVSPQDSLAAKLSHGLRFMLGDSIGMRRSIENVITNVSHDHAHLGYLLGCQSFALEETGDYAAAERVGKKAVLLAPRDAWGLHAVSHVYEMTGRAGDGIGWLENRPDAYAHCNNFSYHVFWHLALFRLELGDHDGALDLYDNHIRNVKTDDFRDIANAASLLTRLELENISIGRRWDELADIAEARVTDGSLVFADLHYLLALLGAGRDDAALLLTAGLDGQSDMAMGRDQRMVATQVGAEMAGALVAFHQERFGEAAETLMRLRPNVQRIGGSHAQRDVFEQITLESVLRSGQLKQAETLLSERIAKRGGVNDFAAKRLRKMMTQEKRSGRVAGMATLALI